MTRSATIRTDVSEPEIVAAALRPDDTDAMTTTVEPTPDGTRRVVTTIDRDSTGGLRSTLDDYVVNCEVADETVQIGKRHANTTHE
ncbi:MAG: KEOPS complex subunit Pcc1 [Halanaeroarchaeum sp.]